MNIGFGFYVFFCIWDHTLKIFFDIFRPPKSKWFDLAKSIFFPEVWTIFVSRILGPKWSPYVAEASLLYIYISIYLYSLYVYNYIFIYIYLFISILIHFSLSLYIYILYIYLTNTFLRACNYLFKRVIIYLYFNVVRMWYIVCDSNIRICM